MGLKIYGKQNVFDAALDRIRWLFDEFPNVICGVSGGKDSTVVFNLTLQVAREKGRLPLKCLFIDQEAEWAATIDQIRYIMEHPDVEPMWFQIPIKLFNATSTTDHWLYCWDAAAKDRWMRPQEDYSYKENRYGTDRFGEIFEAIVAKEFPDTPTCYIAGVRTEESPTRFVALTGSPTYKWATWGKKLNERRKHFTFYPIYDWSYTDVWKAILDNDWPYNAIYDAQYNYGMAVKDMRVSNVHHETSVHSLFYMQEVEPATYVQLTQRIAGIDMAGKMGTADYFVRDLPFMFKDWAEYRDYLLEKLIDNPDWKASFRKEFDRQEALYGDTEHGPEMRRNQINSLLTNDWEHIKLANWERRPQIYNVRRAKQGKTSWQR
jgi:predicted phosphoadenosine phosphosulfate sulfurtransferase